ncbi:MAG: PilZ domain-containing protein [Myxococcales bacterium]|nr:PilZ domain-containing protein [Myxococcales bacterium]
MRPDERRRFPRMPCRMAVRDADSGRSAGRATDISEGGFRLQRLDDQPLMPGQRLTVEVDLPGGSVCAEARVVSVRPHALGPIGALRFTALSTQGARRIGDLCAPAIRLRRGAVPLARIALTRRSTIA